VAIRTVCSALAANTPFNAPSRQRRIGHIPLVGIVVFPVNTGLKMPAQDFMIAQQAE
jgi:hypothetical protein